MELLKSEIINLLQNEKEQDDRSVSRRVRARACRRLRLRAGRRPRELRRQGDVVSAVCGAGRRHTPSGARLSGRSGPVPRTAQRSAQKRSEMV